jgi:hypothetical protein
MGQEAPAFIEEPIIHGRKPAYSNPYALLDVRVDGVRSDYFEWLCAGQYDPARDQGAMARSTDPVVNKIYFGFNLTTFYLRIDLAQRAQQFADTSITVRFTEPHEIEFAADSLRDKSLEVLTGLERKPVGEMAVDRFVELAIPFLELGITEGQQARFQIEITAPDGTTEKLPYSGLIAFTAPTEEFDLIQWQA